MQSLKFRIQSIGEEIDKVEDKTVLNIVQIKGWGAVGIALGRQQGGPREEAVSEDMTDSF